MFHPIHPGTRTTLPTEDGACPSPLDRGGECKERPPCTPRSEKVDPVRYQVPAFCYVKPTRDHLQKVQFDLPDRSRGVPELPRANLGPKNLKNRIMWIYFLRAGGTPASGGPYGDCDEEASRGPFAASLGSGLASCSNKDKDLTVLNETNVPERH